METQFKANLIHNEREFLAKAEMQRMEQVDNLSESLDVVRDLFIFSCYTGISYADLMLLTEKNLVLVFKSQDMDYYSTWKEWYPCKNSFVIKSPESYREIQAPPEMSYRPLFISHNFRPDNEQLLKRNCRRMWHF